MLLELFVLVWYRRGGVMGTGFTGLSTFAEASTVILSIVLDRYRINCKYFCFVEFFHEG